MDPLHPGLFEWRKSHLRDTLLWSHWNTRMQAVFSVLPEPGTLGSRLRSGGRIAVVNFRHDPP